MSMANPPQYGAPQPSAGQPRATGKQLLGACWRLLKQDREMLWLPVVSTLSGALAGAIFFVPGFFLGASVDRAGSHHWALWVGLVFAGFATTVVAVFFQAAIVAAANQRADGGDPDLHSALGAAWKRRSLILKWGVLTATVGTAIRAIEQRAGALGFLVGFLGGITWAIASFLVVPVLVDQDVSPTDALRRSSALIKANWGTGLRSTLRYGVIVLAVQIPLGIVFVVGLALAFGSGAAVPIGILLIVVAGIGLLAAFMVMSAVSTYAQALLYRYAVGLPVPGIEPAVMRASFEPRRRRDRKNGW